MQRRTAARRAQQALPDAIDLFVLAVRAGHLPVAAVEVVLPHLAPVLQPAFSELAAAVRGGTRFADEARQHRRRLADTQARQLPVRLSLPLVLCTFPSFVLLAIVPLLLAAFTSLNR